MPARVPASLPLMQTRARELPAPSEILCLPGTLLAEIYGTSTVTERTNCNYGLAPAFGQLAAEGGMVVSATDETGEVRAVERVDHPFFIIYDLAAGENHKVFEIIYERQ